MGPCSALRLSEGWEHFVFQVLNQGFCILPLAPSKCGGNPTGCAACSWGKSDVAIFFLLAFLSFFFDNSAKISCHELPLISLAFVKTFWCVGSCWSWYGYGNWVVDHLTQQLPCSQCLHHFKSEHCCIIAISRFTNVFALLIKIISGLSNYWINVEEQK